MVWLKMAEGIVLEARDPDVMVAYGEIFTWPRFIYNELKETHLCNRANECLMLCCCEHTGQTYTCL